MNAFLVDFVFRERILKNGAKTVKTLLISRAKTLVEEMGASVQETVLEQLRERKISLKLGPLFTDILFLDSLFIFVS